MTPVIVFDVPNMKLVLHGPIRMHALIYIIYILIQVQQPLNRLDYVLIRKLDTSIILRRLLDCVYAYHQQHTCLCVRGGLFWVTLAFIELDVHWSERESFTIRAEETKVPQGRSRREGSGVGFEGGQGGGSKAVIRTAIFHAINRNCYIFSLD